MAESVIVRTKRDGSLTSNDGTPTTPLTYTVAYEAGDLSITIPGPAVNVFLDRGQFGTTPSLRYGDDQPCTFSFSAHMRDVSDGSVATLFSILNQSGIVGSTPWVSTLGSAATTEVFAVQLVFAIEGTDHGSADYTITLDDCIITGSISEGDPNTINITGTSYDLFPAVA